MKTSIRLIILAALTWLSQPPAIHAQICPSEFIQVLKEGDNGVDGLVGAFSVTVSPDNQNVYVASVTDNALAVFSRNSTTGILTFIQVIKDGVNGVDGLSGARSVTVSPDNQNVYVAGGIENAVAVFSRNGTTGVLTFVQVLKDGINGVDGLLFPTSVTVSPDNKYVYVASRSGSAIVVFSRNSTTGVLTFVEVRYTSLISGASSVTVSPDNQHVYVANDTENAIAVYSRNSTTGVLTFVQRIYSMYLNGARSVTVSPDNQHVYVGSFNDNAVVVFSRNSTTGVLTFVEVLQDGVNGVDGLNGAISVTVSPDNKYVYVASVTDNTVAVFSRNSTTGILTFVEVLQDGVNAVDGLDGAFSVTVSPDNQHVYVTGAAADAVVIFSRNSTTGVLSFVEVLTNGAHTVDGLDGAYSVTVSPDNQHVYVASVNDDAVAVFSRNSTTGVMTFVEVLKDEINGVDGLNGVQSVTVSPDDKHVYVAGAVDDAVAVFIRNSITGVLTFVEVLKDGVNGVDGLNGVRSITVSPDNQHVYAAGREEAAVAVFSRNSTTGILTFVEVLKDGANGVDGLNGAQSVTVSPDNQHVYVASVTDNAVAVFSRNSTTGILTFVEVLQDGVNGVDGLYGVNSVTVSPDNKHVYVANANSVAVFSRNSMTGILTFVEVLQDGVNGVEGLYGAASVTVSPDNQHVYVASQFDYAVAVFSRNSTTGVLTFVQLLQDGANGVDGLNGAISVAVSPNNEHVYVASSVDNAVAVFSAVVSTPTLLASGNNPTNCNSDGSIQLSLTNVPNGNYTINYTGGSFANVTVDSGLATIPTSAGTYNDLSITVKNCTSTEEVDITLSDPIITIYPFPNLTLCNGYQLPAISGINLSGNEAYYTEPNGGGTRYETGTVMTTSSLLYVYDVNGLCSDEKSFMLTINTIPDITALADMEGCGFFILPTITGKNLSGNEAYYTEPNGGGTKYEINDVITSSVLLYIYDAKGYCADEESFMVTIYPVEITFSAEVEEYCGEGRIQLSLTNVPDGDYPINYAGGNFASVTVNSGSATIFAPAGIYNDLSITVNGCTSEEDVDIILPLLNFVESLKDGVNGVDGLNGAYSVTVSPDNQYIYVAGYLDNAIAVFSRNSITGELTFVEVLKDGGMDAAMNIIDGLAGAISVIVSPDNKHVYVAGFDDAAVAVFSRTSMTGALTFVQVLTDGVNGVDGLNGAASITVSPDNQHVYVAGATDDAVAVFSRNSMTGVLTFVEVVKDGGMDAAMNTIDGLNGAVSIIVSPDNKHVYVAGASDNAVAVFSRNSTTGVLTFVHVLKDGVNGVDGLNYAISVTVSPDNKHVYVVGSFDKAVAVFSRNSMTGVLTFVEVVKDGGMDAAMNTIDGLAGARSVTVSPDNKYVYVASSGDQAVAVFSSEGTTGALTFVQVLKDGLNGVDGLNYAISVTVSPDSKHVYAVGYFDSAVAVFSVIVPTPDPTGTSVAIADICSGEDAIVSISGATALSDGTYTFTYVLNGGAPQTAVVTLTGGAGSFSVSGVSMTNNTLALRQLENASTCSNTITGVSDNFVVNDALLDINNTTLTEGNSGSSVASFTVTLSASCSGTVTVNYATVNGTATSGSDYQQKQGTLTFLSGEVSKTVAITVFGDYDFEADETFFVNLSAASGAIVQDGQGQATIQNDDIEPTPCVQGTLVVTNNPTTGYIDAGTYRAEIIVSDGTVQAGTTVNFYASQRIDLVTDVVDDNATDPNTNIGFTVEPNGQFHAARVPCIEFLPFAGSELTNRSEEQQSLDEILPAQELWLKADPNPASDYTRVSFQLPREEPINVRLLNQVGQLIAFPFRQQQYTKGEHNFILYTQDLPAGMYFIQLETKQERIATKIVVTNNR